MALSNIKGTLRLKSIKPIKLKATEGDSSEMKEQQILYEKTEGGKKFQGCSTRRGGNSQSQTRENDQWHLEINLQC